MRGGKGGDERRTGRCPPAAHRLPAAPRQLSPPHSHAEHKHIEHAQSAPWGAGRECASCASRGAWLAPVADSGGGQSGHAQPGMCDAMCRTKAKGVAVREMAA